MKETCRGCDKLTEECIDTTISPVSYQKDDSCSRAGGPLAEYSCLGWSTIVSPGSRSLLHCLGAFALTLLTSALAAKGAHIAGSLAGPGGYFVAYSKDGSRIVASDSETARVFDAQSFKPLTLPLKHGAKITNILWLADDSRVVTIGGKEVRFWDARTGALVVRIAQDQEVGPAAVSPDGKWVVTAAMGGQAELWQSQPPTRIRILEERFPLCWAAFSRDGATILTFNFDLPNRLMGRGVIHLRDRESGRDLIPPTSTDYTGSGVSPAEISPDGNRLVIGGSKTFQVYQVKGFTEITEKKTEDRFLLDSGYTESVHFTPDGGGIVWVVDIGVQLFRADNGEPISKFLDVLVTSRDHLDYSKGKNTLLIAGLTEYAGRWDVGSGNRVETFGDDFSSCIALSPNGKFAAIGRTSPPPGEHGFTEIWKLD